MQKNLNEFLESIYNLGRNYYLRSYQNEDNLLSQAKLNVL
jgi:hypothetical protein